AEAIDCENLAIADCITQDAAEGELTDRFRHVLRIVARTRSEDNATTDKDRCALVAVTGVTGALLFVDLLVVAGNFATGLGIGGAGAAVGTIGGHEVVDGLASALCADEDDISGLSVCF